MDNATRKASVTDVNEGTRVTLTECDNGKFVIGLTAEGKLSVVQLDFQEIDTSQCVVLFYIVQNTDTEYALIPSRNHLQCFLNGVLVLGSEDLCRGCSTIEIGDKVLKFDDGRRKPRKLPQTPGVIVSPLPPPKPPHTNHHSNNISSHSDDIHNTYNDVGNHSNDDSNHDDVTCNHGDDESGESGDTVDGDVDKIVKEEVDGFELVNIEDYAFDIYTTKELVTKCCGLIVQQMTTYTDLQMSVASIGALFSAIEDVAETTAGLDLIVKFLEDVTKSGLNIDTPTRPTYSLLLCLLIDLITLSVDKITSVLLWLELIAALSRVETTTILFIQNDSTPAILGLMSVFTAVPDVQVFCLEILSHIVTHRPAPGELAAVQDMGIELIVRAMTHHSETVKIQRLAVSAVVRDMGIELIVRAMSHHNDTVKIQRLGCRCLANLLTALHQSTCDLAVHGSEVSIGENLSNQLSIVDYLQNAAQPVVLASIRANPSDFGVIAEGKRFVDLMKNKNVPTIRKFDPGAKFENDSVDNENFSDNDQKFSEVDGYFYDDDDDGDDDDDDGDDRVKIKITFDDDDYILGDDDTQENVSYRQNLHVDDTNYEVENEHDDYDISNLLVTNDYDRQTSRDSSVCSNNDDYVSKGILKRRTSESESETNRSFETESESTRKVSFCTNTQDNSKSKRPDSLSINTPKSTKFSGSYGEIIVTSTKYNYDENDGKPDDRVNKNDNHIFLDVNSQDLNELSDLEDIYTTNVEYLDTNDNQDVTDKLQNQRTGVKNQSNIKNTNKISKLKTGPDINQSNRKNTNKNDTDKNTNKESRYRLSNNYDQNVHLQSNEHSTERNAYKHNGRQRKSSSRNTQNGHQKKWGDLDKQNGHETKDVWGQQDATMLMKLFKSEISFHMCSLILRNQGSESLRLLDLPLTELLSTLNLPGGSSGRSFHMCSLILRNQGSESLRLLDLPLTELLSTLNLPDILDGFIWEEIDVTTTTANFDPSFGVALVDAVRYKNLASDMVRTQLNHLVAYLAYPISLQVLQCAIQCFYRQLFNDSLLQVTTDKKFIRHLIRSLPSLPNPSLQIHIDCLQEFLTDQL